MQLVDDDIYYVVSDIGEQLRWDYVGFWGIPQAAIVDSLVVKLL